MGKKRDDRGRDRSKAESECDLDGSYTSPIRSYRDLSAGTIRDTLVHSRYMQILLALTLFGILLRFYNLGFNSIWLDEASTLNTAVKGLPEIWQATVAGEFNPPLFYWTEHFMLVFGNSEAVLRFVPALLGVLTIPLIYLAGREFADRNVGIIAAAAAAFSPFLILYSQDARAYTMMLFFLAAATIFCLRALKEGDLKDWILFGICSALAFWTHFYAMVMIGALAVYALYELLPKIRSDVTALKGAVISGAVFLVLCLPLILVTIQLFAKRTSSAPTFGIQGIGIIVQTLEQLSGPSAILGSLPFLVLGLLFLLGIATALYMDRNKAVFLLVLMILTFVISYFLSFKIPMMPRYLIFIAIVFFLGIALSYRLFWQLLNTSAVVYGLILLIVLLAVPALAGYYSGFSKEDWRGFSAEMKQLTKDGDIVVVLPPYITQPLDYYYQNQTDRTWEYGAYDSAELEAAYLRKGNNSLYFVVTGDIQSANPNGDAVAWLEKNTKLVGQKTGIYLFTIQ